MNLIMALGVTYYARLENRDEYAKAMIAHLGQMRKAANANRLFTKIIETCQDKFIDELKLDSNIAKNGALKVRRICFIKIVETYHTSYSLYLGKCLDDGNLH